MAPGSGRLAPRLWVGGLLAVLGGYADVVAFERYGEFAGLMTGTMLFLGLAVISKTSPLFNVAVMAANAAGVVGVCLLKDADLPTRVAAPAVALCALATDFLDFFVGREKWHVLALACSLGATNYLSFSGDVGAMTTLATGNLQKCAKAFYSVVLRRKALDDADRRTTAVASVVVVGTILGAVLGAAALRYGPHHWIFSPVAALQLVVLSVHDAAFTSPPKATFLLGEDPHVDVYEPLRPSDDDDDDLSALSIRAERSTAAAATDDDDLPI